MRSILRLAALSLLIGSIAACTPQSDPIALQTPNISVLPAGTAVPMLTAPAPSPVAAAPTGAASTTLPATASATARSSTSPPATPTASQGINVRLNEPFTLRLGQWANLPDASGSRVIFSSLREDTRCPVKPAAKCDGVGRALVAIGLEDSAKLAELELSSNPGEFRTLGAFNGYVVELIDVTPYPQQTAPKIAPGDYQVMLRVNGGSLDVSQARFREPFTLKAGQSIGIEGSTMRLSFTAVTQDSRCPTRVLCVTRGTATVAIVATHDGATYNYSLEVGGNGARTSFPAVRTVAVTIYARALTPYPRQEFASKEIAVTDYQVTLLVDNPAMPQPSATPRKP